MTLPGLSFLDAINVPSGSGTGDDRYGFDESSGTAWVIDGATDVGTQRLFDQPVIGEDGRVMIWESDAAWYADRLSERLVRPPETAESARDYLQRVLTHMEGKARTDARFPIDGQPRHNLPSAGGIWMRRRENILEFATLGDCIAIVRTGGKTQIIGDVEGIRAEYTLWGGDMRRASREAGFAKAREIRNVMNTPGHHWVFSLHAEAAEHANVEQVRLHNEAHVLLMSDGFFRLVEPYQAYSADELLTLALASDGLPHLISQLRGREQNPQDDAAMGRLKTSDDACALLVEVSPEA